MAHNPYHIDFSALSSFKSPPPEAKTQITKTSVTQEQIQEAIRKLDAGEVQYQMPNQQWEGGNKWGKSYSNVFKSFEEEVDKGSFHKGEIIELQKIHYGASSVSELLDRSFNEITKTRDNISPENFFNLYNQLFYDIPKDGKQSHTFLIEESTDYIGGYEDLKGEKVNSLIDRVIELEQQSIESEQEHPLFRNGTALRLRGWSSHIVVMQEGKARRVSNVGDPNPWEQMKKLLGKVDGEGKVLENKLACIDVSQDTWDSLPHWPVGTDINDKADWFLTLKSFNIAASNITLITENIENSELDSFEIKKLIGKLQNKTPFEGYTIEDNYNGTIEYTEKDLLPIGWEGTWQGQKTVLYSGNHERLRSSNPVSKIFPITIEEAIDAIIGYWEAQDARGLYDLGGWEEADFGHMTPAEEDKWKDREDVRYVAAAAAGNYYHRKGLPRPHKGTDAKDHVYGEDWKSYLIEDLEQLRAEVLDNKFTRYIWQVDWERSYNKQTVDGSPMFNGKYYWVPEWSDENIQQGSSAKANKYMSYAAWRAKEAIEDRIYHYSHHHWLTVLEDPERYG